MSNRDVPDSDLFCISRRDFAILAVSLTGAGIALGLFLPALAAFAAKYPIPFAAYIEGLAEIDNPVVVLLRPLIGGALGAIVAMILYLSTPRLTISSEAIVIDRRDQQPLRITRASYSTAYFDDGKLTIITQGGHRAFHGSVEGKREQIAAAFRKYGYRFGEI